MDPDLRRRLTCWPPISIIESSAGRLAVFSLSYRAACEMKTELQDLVIGGLLSDAGFARAAARYICFPEDRLRDGYCRPSNTVLTEEQCFSLTETELQAIAEVYVKREFPNDTLSSPLSALKAGHATRWKIENEQHAAELLGSLADYRRRIEVLAADGVDIHGLSSDELLRMLRKSEALRSYERFRDVATIAKQGWFIDAHMPVGVLRNAADYIRSTEVSDNPRDKESAVDELQSAFVDYYESRYDQIKASILHRFECRRHILGPAFTAHEDHLYCLSIPVFISQADGIFKQNRGFSLFCGDNLSGDASFKELLNSIRDQVLDRHEISWSNLLPLLFHAKTEGENPFKSTTSRSDALTCENFNRHAIMHGLCTFYATRENSLRYISLLGHLAWILGRRD